MEADHNPGAGGNRLINHSQRPVEEVLNVYQVRLDGVEDAGETLLGPGGSVRGHRPRGRVGGERAECAGMAEAELAGGGVSNGHVIAVAQPVSERLGVQLDAGQVVVLVEQEQQARLLGCSHDGTRIVATGGSAVATRVQKRGWSG